MKKFFFLAATVLMMTAGCATAQETRKLPEPKLAEVKMTLMDALKQRESVREFDANKNIDDATLAKVLWAACGISRPESGKITAPSAINAQDIQVYVCSKNGAWLFDAKEFKLEKVSDEDLRELIAGPQKSVASAPINLVLVSDQGRFRGPGNATYGAMDAGYVSQNIYLVCTALGMKTVARAMMPKEEIAKKLNLRENQIVELNHPIGY